MPGSFLITSQNNFPHNHFADIQRHFVEPPRDTTVAKGDDAIFGCLAPLGEPDPVISWRKDGASVVMGGRISVDALDRLRIEVLINLSHSAFCLVCFFRYLILLFKSKNMCDISTFN